LGYYYLVTTSGAVLFLKLPNLIVFDVMVSFTRRPEIGQIKSDRLVQTKIACDNVHLVPVMALFIGYSSPLPLRVFLSPLTLKIACEDLCPDKILIVMRQSYSITSYCGEFVTGSAVHVLYFCTEHDA
jgi:hypothetical protein